MSSRTSKPDVGSVRNTAKDDAAPDLPPIPANVVKNLTSEQLMKLTFRLMMDTGNYVDTKFYAYSCRKATGAVYAPKAVYANSYLLRARAPEYFEPTFHGQYDGYSIVEPLNTGFPAKFPGEMDGSGFESDSDIEDDDDQEVAAPSSDKGSQMRLGAAASSDEKEDTKDTLASGNVGRVRLVPTFAYSTWRAFIFYVATGDISFAPLRSQKQPLSSSKVSSVAVNAPTCSPKSIYRLAEEIGLDDLKELAKKDIESKISDENIIVELFSSFTANHDEIRDLQLDLACSKARNAVSQGFFEVLKNTPADSMKRAEIVIAGLVQKLAMAKPRPTGCRSCGFHEKNGNFTLVCGHCRNQNWFVT